MIRTQDHKTHDPTHQATAAERQAMQRAVELAARGPRGENPQVGAVILDANQRVLAEGWHRGAGSAHAEVAALDALRAAGLSASGTTMVVTLEPCDHTGRTPPCSRTLIAAGVRRVVYGLDDPQPPAAGGADRLRHAGIEVVAGVRADAVATQLAGWLAGQHRDRPWVTVKIAQSLDAKVAAADGSSRWITGTAARRHAHQVRSQVSAIIVGTGTVLADDPQLTVRDADGRLADVQPERVVVGHREIGEHAALRGPGGPLRQLATHDPGEVLDVLAAAGHRRVLVEGGPQLASAFVAAGLVDELHCYLAPVLLGAGTCAVADLGVSTLATAPRWRIAATHHLDPDLLVIAHPMKENPCLPE